ncbi:LysR family transcriptional regulator [Cupriavidus necator]|uniref:LysR family transcriptional regulator n=1 Tax=Cupriavidus necator TaxID=106590 RepID=UPI003BEEFFBC
MTAVSNALARLRTLFGDPLFVRSSKGMLPTPLALFWHARYHRDPANQWLRDRFVGLFSD